VANEDPLILDFGNGKVPEGADLDEYYVNGLDDELSKWDYIDLEEAFDLPPVLPPVRLPEETELAAQARRSTLLADLRADDGRALQAWEYTFAEVLDTTLEAADDSDPFVAHDLDLEGHGPALVTRLFLSRRDGVRITELADALKNAGTVGLAEEEAGGEWQEWVEAHGDPLRLLLGQLERLGAVSVTDDAARLEPLGVQAVRSKLESDGLFVPVLPAPDNMTPDDLVLAFMHGSDDDLEAELASWRDSRGGGNDCGSARPGRRARLARGAGPRRAPLLCEGAARQAGRRLPGTGRPRTVRHNF
jgi:hypothetical protein